MKDNTGQTRHCRIYKQSLWSFWSSDMRREMATILASAVDAAAAASKADKGECDVLAHGTERLCASGWVFGVYAVRDGRKALVCRARCQGGHLVCPFVCVHCTLV